MKRIGLAALFLTLSLVALPACEDSSENANQTGIELSFTGCSTFGAWVSVDDEYQGEYSSEEPAFIPIGAGSHSIYVHSNAKIAASLISYCWNINVTVSDGETSDVVLDCTGAECTTTQ